MENSEVLAAFEALLLAADEPLDAGAVSEAIPGVDSGEVQSLAAMLDLKYQEGAHGITVQRVAGGWRLATRAEYADIVKRHLKNRQKQRLSRAALEVVSIIAYRQPISRAEIEAIRGVDSVPVIHTLLERNLIHVTGRAEAPGRPLLYGTTDAFLVYFGLDNLKSLPDPQELLGIENEEEPNRPNQGPFMAMRSE